MHEYLYAMSFLLNLVLLLFSYYAIGLVGRIGKLLNEFKHVTGMALATQDRRNELLSRQNELLKQKIMSLERGL